METLLPHQPAEAADLVRPDTALLSFRDSGYTFTDAVGEIVDNTVQSGATSVHLGWTLGEAEASGAKKAVETVDSFAIADDGLGIPPNILPHTLTVGFSTRYGDRTGIGRFGVGFKLASISQCRRLEVYTRPEYLHGERVVAPQTGPIEETTRAEWSYSQPNTEGHVFKTYLDLDEIGSGRQTSYVSERVDTFPGEYAGLMEDAGGEPRTGTLVVWQKLDRVNEDRSFAERAEEKLKKLEYFLRRTYRYYIDGGLEIYLQGRPEPLPPYDPAFLLDNPESDRLAPSHSMRGVIVDEGEIRVDGHPVRWRVTLTPEVTRLESGGGGVNGPDQKGQFRSLHIPDNERKVSFLRHNREISYTFVPYFIPPDELDPKSALDRYIAVEVFFPPALDEYFQVRNVKRGAVPVEKLKRQLIDALTKTVKTARRRVRDRWSQSSRESAGGGASTRKPEDVSGGRGKSESLVGDSAGLPAGRAGQSKTPDQTDQMLRRAAEDAGITDPAEKEAFVEQARQKPVVAVETEWPGKGLLDIDHLFRNVIVRINRRHPLIREVYLPLREAVARGTDTMDPYKVQALMEKAALAIDLILFSYAKAENQHPDPETAYLDLREDLGRFAAVYLRRLDDVAVG